MVDSRGSSGQWSTAVVAAADYGEDQGSQWAAAAAVGSGVSGGRWPGMILMGKEQCKKWLLASFVFILLY
jgi:hypothetical protein